jgi:hypothetical protein
MGDCEHNWVLLKEVDISFKTMKSSGDEESIGFIFYCSKCLEFEFKGLETLGKKIWK